MRDILTSQATLTETTIEAPVSRWRYESLLWAALFALAHTQSPEFYSNQHQYYLHGFAQAGVGTHSEDWLANTKDPTPIFSFGIEWIVRLFGPWALHGVYFLLLALFFESICRIVTSRMANVLFMALFIASHAAGLRTLSLWLTGVDYPWFLQAGLAAQYLLGPGLQPSVFGILLVTSIAAFVNDRPLWACGLAASCAAIHTTYLLPAGLLTFAYLVVLMREKQWRRALLGGAIALAIVAPVIAWTLKTFTGGDEAQFREAQRILAEERIPHHAVVARWLDWVAVVQIALMFLAIHLVHRTRLFWVLTIPTAVCLGLTLLQVVTGSPTLALMFPWRWSAILMPVATAILLHRFTLLVIPYLHGSITNNASRLAGTAFAIAGVVIMVGGHGFYTNDAELPLLAHVRETKQPGYVYLIPAKFPTLKKERPASQSKTYAPPVRTGAVGIPVDLQRFRLTTAAPIYIDFKAPPYEASEVLEWHRRLKNAERWYADRDWDRTGFVEEIAKEGITHVITAADKPIQSGRLELVYPGENYWVYRVK